MEERKEKQKYHEKLAHTKIEKLEADVNEIITNLINLDK